MSDFQQQLDDEIEKREAETEHEEADAEEKIEAKPAPRKKAPQNFSLGALAKGIAACLVFFIALGIYAQFKASDTKDQMASKLPSKTAIVKQGDTNTYRLGESQPVLRMPAVEETGTPQVDQAEESKSNDALASKYDSSEGLVPAPIPGLYESSSEGLLPLSRKDDGLTPFEAYKRPFQKNTEKPIISFVVTDMGISRRATEAIIEELPEEVSLAFSTYARDLKLLTDVARKAGHEVWLTLPMETKRFPLNDPGPSTLLVNASVEQNKNRLTSILASTQGYVGFVSEKSHVFRQEDAEVNPSLQEIFERGLAVLDSNTSVSNFVGKLASKKDYPNAKTHFWLDENLSSIALNQQLRKMMEFSQSSGKVIVLLRPYPASINAVQKFIQSEAARNFQIAPVSAQVIYGE